MIAPLGYVVFRRDGYSADWRPLGAALPAGAIVGVVARTSAMSSELPCERFVLHGFLDDASSPYAQAEKEARETMDAWGAWGPLLDLNFLEPSDA